MPETYEGRPCKHCGGTRRYRSDRGCVACRNASWSAGRDAARDDPVYRYLEQLLNRRRKALKRMDQRNARRNANG